MRTWTLCGATTEYTVGVPDHGRWAELIGWGPTGQSHGPSTAAQSGQVNFVTAAEFAPVEYAVRGVRFTGPTELVVAGSDGSDECQPLFISADYDVGDAAETLDLSFADPQVPLRVALHYRMPVGLDVVERSVSVTNNGTDPFALYTHDSAAFVAPTLGGARLRYLWGYWLTEFRQAEIVMPAGRFEIGSRQGITGHSFSPYLCVTDASLDHGTCWGVQLAWSGSWHITADVDVTGQTRLSAGRVPSRHGLTLAPGATWRSPLAVGGCSIAGPDGLARVFHAYQRALAGDRLDRPRPVIYNSWEATEFDVRAGHQLELAERAALAGVETFVIDDGWFTGRVDDRGGLGDWYVDEQAFPGGLEPFIAQVRELGLDFGLWVEPESVSPSSELANKHPEWILRTAGREPHLIRNQLLLDLGRDDVGNWVWETLHRLLSSYDISYLKWDANRARLDSGDHRYRDLDGDAGSNLYRILDQLRAEHPQVYIEGCASGGGRIDLGMAARVDTFWASDNTAPLDRLRIQRGFLSGWSPHLMSSWVTDAQGLHDARARSLDFRFHVAMAGGLGIGVDLSSWDDEQLTTARRWIKQYRAVRDLVTHGEVHWLTPPGDTTVGLQYLGGDRSLVLLYDTGNKAVDGQLPSRRRRIPLAGLQPETRYRVGDEELTGRYLIHVGLPDPRDLGVDSLCIVVEPVA